MAGFFRDRHGVPDTLYMLGWLRDSGTETTHREVKAKELATKLEEATAAFDLAHREAFDFINTSVAFHHGEGEGE